MNEEIKVFLVDDHDIVRSGMKTLIGRSEGLSVCGEAGSLKETYEKIPKALPDIVMLDIKLPDGDGASGCREIKKRFPHIKVMILSAFSDDTIVLETIKAGADGYLLKSVDSQNIIRGLRELSVGNPSLDPVIMHKVMHAVKTEQTFDHTHNLNMQEQQILELMCQGKKNREISEQLIIPEKTVRNNVSRILKKLNASNRTEAAMYWQKYKSLT